MARILSQVAGHEDIIQRLLDARKNGRLPSTFLFIGPAGVGRKKVARGLAQALVCEKTPVGCGECGACVRIAENQSEALLTIEPEKTQIKIDQTREVLDFLSLRSMSKARVIIIDEAHLLNPQAGNSLLKILEEPPDNTYFFLIAPSARHVLPTLRSRSQIVRFGALTEEDLRRHRPAPEWALHSAMGSFERLEGLVGRDETQARNLAWELLGRWWKNEQVFMAPEAKEWLRDRPVLLSLARAWTLAFRDAALYKAGERRRILNADQIKGIETLASLEDGQLHDIAKLALDFEGAMMAQRDAQLAFEEFWIRSRRRVEREIVL